MGDPIQKYGAFVELVQMAALNALATRGLWALFRFGSKRWNTCHNEEQQHEHIDETNKHHITGSTAYTRMKEKWTYIDEWNYKPEFRHFGEITTYRLLLLHIRRSRQWICSADRRQTSSFPFRSGRAGGRSSSTKGRMDLQIWVKSAWMCSRCFSLDWWQWWHREDSINFAGGTQRKSLVWTFFSCRITNGEIAIAGRLLRLTQGHA